MYQQHLTKNIDYGPGDQHNPDMITYLNIVHKWHRLPQHKAYNNLKCHTK